MGRVSQGTKKKEPLSQNKELLAYTYGVGRKKHQKVPKGTVWVVKPYLESRHLGDADPEAARAGEALEHRVARDVAGEEGPWPWGW